MSAADALNKAVDRAIAIQHPVVLKAVQGARKEGEPPFATLRRLERAFMAAVSGSGAAVGATAAAPGVGTGVAVALSAGDTVAFLEASALLTLAAAEIHGIPVAHVERRRTLVLAIMLGESGSTIIEKAAGRTGKYWGRKVAESVPLETIRAVNRVLGPNFVTRYGTKQGIIVLGRAAPFGIGAAIGGGANYLLARGVVAGVRRAFGEAPPEWPVRLRAY